MFEGSTSKPWLAGRLRRLLRIGLLLVGIIALLAGTAWAVSRTQTPHQLTLRDLAVRFSTTTSPSGLPNSPLDTTMWQRFTSQDLRLSIEYPSDWIVNTRVPQQIAFSPFPEDALVIIQEHSPESLPQMLSRDLAVASSSISIYLHSIGSMPQLVAEVQRVTNLPELPVWHRYYLDTGEKLLTITSADSANTGLSMLHTLQILP